jgi:hypothetical protein
VRRTHSRVTDRPLQNRSVFTHEVRKISSKHRHQGGLVIYVINGKEYFALWVSEEGFALVATIAFAE